MATGAGGGDGSGSGAANGPPEIVASEAAAFSESPRAPCDKLFSNSSARLRVVGSFIAGELFMAMRRRGAAPVAPLAAKAAAATLAGSQECVRRFKLARAPGARRAPPMSRKLITIIASDLAGLGRARLRSLASRGQAASEIKRPAGHGHGDGHGDGHLFKVAARG